MPPVIEQCLAGQKCTLTIEVVRIFGAREQSRRSIDAPLPESGTVKCLLSPVRAIFSAEDQEGPIFGAHEESQRSIDAPLPGSGTVKCL